MGKNNELTVKIIIVVISFLLAFMLSLRPLDNSDYGFHLRTGQDIVKNHHFPMTENYSYTAKGNFNPAYSWIFDSISYVFYEAGNINGLIYLQILLIFIIFSIILTHLFKTELLRQNFLLSVPVALNIILAFSFLLMPRIMIRPHLLGYVFLSLFIIVMDRVAHEQKDIHDTKNFFKNNNFWIAIVIFLFWINSHSSFVEAFVFLGIWIISEIISNILGNKKTEFTKFLFFALIFGFLSFFTPNFNKIFATFVSASKSTEEFYSLFEIFPAWGLFYTVIIFLYIILFIRIAVYYFRIKDFYRSFSIIFFTALGIYSIRFLGEAGIVVGIMSVPAAVDMVKHAEKKPEIKRILLILLISLTIAQSGLILEYHKPVRMGMDETKLPVYSTAYLNKLDLDGRMFNYLGWGGYLIWELQKYPVFIDGRMQVYSNNFLNNCSKMLRKPPIYFYEQCAKYGISFAVVPYATNFGDMIVDDFSDYLFDKNEWALVYFDNNSLVYLKRGFSKKNDAIIARDEYSILEPTIWQPALLYKYLNNVTTRQKLIKDLHVFDQYLDNNSTTQKLINELQRSVSEYPDCVYSHFCLAYVKFKTGDFTGATRELDITRKLTHNIR